MATFRPYDGEGYGGLDTYEVTTLNGMDLKGRLPGDVLQEILYAGPEGEIHPALGVGCHPDKIFSYDPDPVDGRVRILPINTPMKTVDEDKLRMLRSRFVLGADPKTVAKNDQNAQNARLFARGSPVTDDYGVPNVPQVSAGGPARYSGARSIIAYRTPCECKALIERAALKFGRMYTTEYSRFVRDFHGQDQRFFNDSDIIIQEFYGMPNATSLAIMLAKAGVIESPPFPLRVCKGRDQPCACSVVGPELVNRIYYFLVDDWEHDAIYRKDPISHNIGNLLARYNERVMTFFSADDYNRRLLQSQEQRVIDMARLMGDRKGSGNPGAAGTWNYEPFPAREPGRGRLTLLRDEPGGVTENKRRLSEKIARRYGFTLLPDGRLIDENEPRDVAL